MRMVKPRRLLRARLDLDISLGTLAPTLVTEGGCQFGSGTLVLLSAIRRRYNAHVLPPFGGRRCGGSLADGPLPGRCIDEPTSRTPALGPAPDEEAPGEPAGG